jgi:hypothetical protein
MPSRVIAFFLALVLFWSGLGTIETPSTSAQPPCEQACVGVAAGMPVDTHGGSVEDHHLDDLPVQAQNEPPAETPDLLPALARPVAQSAAMTPPHGDLAATARPLFLAGPLRPPCSEARSG